MLALAVQTRAPKETCLYKKSTNFIKPIHTSHSIMQYKASTTYINSLKNIKTMVSLRQREIDLASVFKTTWIQHTVAHPAQRDTNHDRTGHIYLTFILKIKSVQSVSPMYSFHSSSMALTHVYITKYKFKKNKQQT